MSILEIIAIIVFTLTLSSYGLILEQKRKHSVDKMPMFRSELFSNIVFFPSFILMVTSGITLGLYSWKMLIIVFIITVILYPVLGRFLVVRFWSLPYHHLNKQAEKKLSKEK